MQEKEAHLDKQYKAKTEEMKVNMKEIKTKFEERCAEFKQQLLEFKNNNEAIEALKKAHKIELAAHVQEHNKKYNELLQSKLDSEDALKEKAQKDLAKLTAELNDKCARAVEETKRKEQQAAKIQIDKIRADYDEDFRTLQGQIEKLQENIQGLEKEIKQKDVTIMQKDETIGEHKNQIKVLEDEIQKLKNLAAMGDQNASEL